MWSDIAIRAQGLGKTYQVYERPIDRFKQLLFKRARVYSRAHKALDPLSFELHKGEVLGIVGTNGSGKSTLLQLITGVLEPTSGVVEVRGRVAALLELGAGFNPDFTGRENIALNATLLGLSSREIEQRTESIIEFSGIRDAIDQPVKTYSSGMYVRLAFSIATAVDPDILIIDEALSVGDGAFARKSFDRIMQLKAAGATILFCSHNVYQVEVLCKQVMWLDKGTLRAYGDAAMVCQQYNEYLERLSPTLPDEDTLVPGVATPEAALSPSEAAASSLGGARLSSVQIGVDGQITQPLTVRSGVSSLEVAVAFLSSPEVPPPSVAVVITDASGRNITSCSTHYDGLTVTRDANGKGIVRLCLEHIPLLRGRYTVHVFLMCERALLIYDHAPVTEFQVEQIGHEIGLVSLPRRWAMGEEGLACR